MPLTLLELEHRSLIYHSSPLSVTPPKHPHIYTNHLSKYTVYVMVFIANTKILQLQYSVTVVKLYEHIFLCLSNPEMEKCETLVSVARDR